MTRIPARLIIRRKDLRKSREVSSLSLRSLAKMIKRVYVHVQKVTACNLSSIKEY